MFRNMIGIVVVAGLVFALAPVAHADIISFQEGVSPTGAYTHDATYIRSRTTPDPGHDDNFDSAGQMIVGTTIEDVLRSLLEFDVSAIPATDQIDAASLVLTTTQSDIGTGLDLGGETGNPTFKLYAYGFDIDETTATWIAPGSGDTTAGGTLGTLLTSANFDVTQTGLAVTFGDSAAFRTAVANALAGDGLLRLIVAKNDEGTVGTHEFARFSDDSVATTGERPELVVEHTPEPATMTLLALGGLAILRRRRNRA
jgi:hypothetical protein